MLNKENVKRNHFSHHTKLFFISYVLLLAHFPLFYYVNNLDELQINAFIGSAILTFTIGLGITAASFAIQRWLLRKSFNPLFGLVNIFMFFIYGHVYILLQNTGPVSNVYVLPFFFAFFLLALKFMPLPSVKLGQVVLGIIMVLVILDVTTGLTNYDFENTPTIWKQSYDFSNVSLEGFPSIIWILPDGYPSSEFLSQHADYDNSFFEAELENMGFDILDVKSNYDATSLSLASTLNMDYHESVGQPYILKDQIKQSSLIKLLQNNDYSLELIASVYGTFTFKDKSSLDSDEIPKENIPIFDKASCQGNYASENYLVEFFTSQSHFAKTNILRFVTWYIEHTNIRYSTYAFLGHECFFTELNNTKNLDPTQKFVFAHILLPHSPYFIEDENGNVQTYIGDRITRIGNNMEIINKRLISVLPNLIKNNPDTIIVILSDHGIKKLEENYDDTLKETVFKHTKFDNFLAVYLPDNIHMNDKITNVNVFRDILRSADPNIPLLEDKFFYDDDI